MKSIITSREKKIYERIIEEATVDCKDEYEQISGWICLLDENIATPCNCTIGKQNIVLEKIDQMVYKLYELMPEEIKIVEGFGK